MDIRKEELIFIGIWLVFTLIGVFAQGYFISLKDKKQDVEKELDNKA